MTEHGPLDKSVNRFFETDHLRDDLRGRSVRGGTVTLFAQGGKFGLQLASQVCLGLLAMVMAVTGFVTMFKDLGLSMATVQREETNHRQVSTLFWVNIALSMVIILVTAAIAPAIAWFYGEPRLTWVTLALASAFIFSGLTVQHQALLRRQMRFASLAMVDTASMFVGVAAAIISALLGLGYWALVIQQLAFGAATAAGVWITCEWRPGRPFRNSGVRSMLAFGGYITGFNVVNYFARNLDKMLIGWYWGPSITGFYSKAYSLLLLPIQQITPPISAVAIPALSRLQGNAQQFRNYYLKALSLLTFVTVPLAVFLFLTSREVIEFVLGPQWAQATGIFQYLAISAIAQPVMNSTGWLYVCSGRTRAMLLWGLVATICVSVAFILGLPHGAERVALYYTGTTVLLLVPGLHYATIGTTISIGDVARTVRDSFISSVIAGATVFGLKQSICAGLPAWATVIICLVAMAGIHVASVFFLFRKKGFYLSVVSELRRQRSPSRIAPA